MGSKYRTADDMLKKMKKEVVKRGKKREKTYHLLTKKIQLTKDKYNKFYDLRKATTNKLRVIGNNIKKMEREKQHLHFLLYDDE